jgi:hypothetical protein
MHRLFSSRALILLMPLLFLTACKAKLIPNTAVRDTSENRAVMDFFKQYKQATESRSVKDVMALVADDYFENGTRFESNDKYGHAQLAEKLTKAFDKVEAMNLSYFIQNVKREENLVKVVYYFVERALIKYPSESKWLSVNDVNQVVLRMKGRTAAEGFEVVSGL